jgi:dienelactone hydrolase
MKPFLWVCIIILLLFSAACSPAAAPLPTPEPVLQGQEAIPDTSLNASINLTGAWKFQKVAQWDEAITKPGFDDSSWSETQAPAGWDAQGLSDQVGQGTVVVYRKTVDIPANWKGLPIGISAWFNPFASRVFINGEQVEPARTPFAPYADISRSLKYGAKNSIAVAVQYDGYLEFAEAGPARIGPVVARPVTKILQDAISLDTPSGKIEAVFFHPDGKTGLPALVLAATGSHGLGEMESWTDLATDLARQGYASLAIAMANQSPEGVQAAVSFLRANSAVNPADIILFGVDAAAPAVVSTATSNSQVRGVILLSASEVEGIEKIGGRPLLFMAAQGDRNGFYIDQAKAMAQKAGVKAEVISLPGNGHGTFVLQNTWNAVRSSLLKWLKE